jgi:hypothetical protein
MTYVQIDGSGKVTAIYGGNQPGISGCTDVADNDPRIAAFLTGGKPQRITGSQFINRFTPLEQMALATAAMGNPQMMLFMISMAAAGTIDLTDPAVAAGVNGLVGNVIANSARAAAVLDH